MAESNPVSTSSGNQSGQMSALGSGSYDWGGIDTLDASDFGSQTPGMPDYGSMTDDQLSQYLGTPSNVDWSSLLSNISGSSGSGGSSSGGSGISGLLSSILGGGGVGGLGGVLPYATVAGIGLSQANSARNDARARENELRNLGSPYVTAGQNALSQYTHGTLRPDQQTVVDSANQYGQNLIDSTSGLSAIAQQAFQDYQAGKLPPADEEKLNAQLSAQKQEARQRLTSSGMVDSSLMASMDAQLESQSKQTRQSLLDARFATGNQAYDQWLKGTEAGQQLRLQGQQFATQSLDTMLQQSLDLGRAGMEPIAQAIQLAMQSDTELSGQVSDLLGNLAAAYSYAIAGGNGAGAAGGSKNGSNLLQSIMGGISGIGNLVKGVGSLFGNGSAANPSGAGGQAAAGSGSGSGSSLGSVGNAAGVSLADAGLNAGWGSGALGNQALGDAINGTTTDLASTSAKGMPATSSASGAASALGSAYGVYSGIEEGGAGGTINAGFSGAQLATSLGAGGATASVAAVAPYAAAGFAIAGIANHLLGNDKSHVVTAQLNNWVQQAGVTRKNYGRAGSVYVMPDGRVVKEPALYPIIQAAADGDMAKYNSLLAGLKTDPAAQQLYKHYG